LEKPQLLSALHWQTMSENSDANKPPSTSTCDGIHVGVVCKRDGNSFTTPNFASRERFVAQCVAFLSENDLVSLTGQNTSSFALLGKGRCATVTSCWLAHARLHLAIKFVSHAAWHFTFAENQSVQIREKVEPTVACFVTRHLLRHCPHFCAAFAYRLGRASFHHNRLRFGRSYSPSMILLSEPATGTLLDFLKCHVASPDTSVLLSLTIQVFLAIGALSSVGISHNDVFARNVLLFRCPADSVIEFHFDSRREPLRLRTYGQLAALCDFGLSSHEDWQCDPRLAEAKSLAAFYNAPDKVISERPRQLFIAASGKVLHPLQYEALYTNERDFASFCSETILRWEECRLFKLAAYLHSVLVSLDKFRPRRGDAFVEFVRFVTAPLFVAAFCDSNQLPFVSDATTTIAASYSFPTAEESSVLRQKLCADLSRSATLDQLVTE
jgi:hypothetical protein